MIIELLKNITKQWSDRHFKVNINSYYTNFYETFRKIIIIRFQNQILIHCINQISIKLKLHFLKTQTLAIQRLTLSRKTIKQHLNLFHLTPTNSHTYTPLFQHSSFFAYYVYNVLASKETNFIIFYRHPYISNQSQYI